MTWRLCPLTPGEIDHELLWGSVLAVAGLLAAAAFAAGGLPHLGCPFKALTGLPCLTCGATRMVAALMQGQLAAAVRLNPLLGLAAIGSVPFAVYAWTAALLHTRRVRLTVSPAGATLVRATTWLALAANWVFLILDGR